MWKVIEYCSIEQLDDREIFWTARLGTKLPNGFNKTDGGKGCRGFVPSENTCTKMSNAWSAERKQINGECTKLRWESDEYRLSMQQKLIAAWTNERKELISTKMKARFATMTNAERLARSKKISDSHADMSGSKNPRARAVRCLETREVFSTLKEAATHYGINYSTLKSYMQGWNTNTKGYNFEYLN